MCAKEKNYGMIYEKKEKISSGKKNLPISLIFKIL
jgi:hypothetical protein